VGGGDDHGGNGRTPDPGHGSRFILTEATEPVAITVRPEVAGDVGAIRAIHNAAFGQPDEGRIVDAIRAAGPEGWRSLVAEDNQGRVVGHLLLSPCDVERPDGSVAGTVLALGPVAVDPGVQYRGVGSSLVAASLGLAVARAAPAVVLLGHPAYYPRFGFGPARDLGLEPPADWPDDAWMARRLPAWTPDLRGVVRYPAAFGVA
jgi:putative acetyltransferase